MELPGRTYLEEDQKRFMDVVKEDIKLVGVREEDAEDTVRIWTQMERKGKEVEVIGVIREVNLA